MNYYLTTGALVTVLWLGVVSFCYLKMRNASDTKKNFRQAPEMIQMSEETQDGNVIYRDVVFKNKNNKKPNEKKSEETTYAEIKTQDGNVIYRDVVFKKKNNKKPMQVESEETTYAEIKKASKDSGVVYTEVKPNAKSKAKDLPRNTEPETLYACVNKKKPATAKHN